MKYINEYERISLIMKYWICVCGLLLKCFVDSILIVEKYEIYKLLVYFVFINYYSGWYMVVV